MPNVQWNDIPFQLISAASTIDINPLIGVISPSTPHPTGPQWILLPDGCAAGAAKRVARDNTPQKPGEIIHKKYKSGVVFQLKALAANVTNGQEMAPACGSDLVNLFDALLLCLNAMENADGRLVWTPTGHASRLLNDARWLGADAGGGGGFTSVAVAVENDVFTAVEFALLSPFPYVQNYTEIDTPISGTPATLNNTGNTGFYPVIHVDGPTSAFVIHNNTTGLLLSWDASFPGAVPVPGGKTVEFDFFREVAYMGPTGGPYVDTNMKPGIDILTSDFWTLEPGNNSVELDGATGTVLWQAAYTG